MSISYINTLIVVWMKHGVCMLKHFLTEYVPNKTFQTIHEHLVVTDFFEKRVHLSFTTSDLNELVLNQIQDYSSSSTGHVERAQTYHLQRLQGLTEADFLPTQVFCTWLHPKQMCVQNQHFLSANWWTKFLLRIECQAFTILMYELPINPCSWNQVLFWWVMVHGCS